MNQARRIVIRGIVQGVGFRPFVARLAAAHDLSGWVLNDHRGVEIHVEGPAGSLDAFARALERSRPAAARIEAVESAEVPTGCLRGFRIRESVRAETPTARISPDLPVCDACLAEMQDPSSRRFGYPYISCTDCGPRYSIVESLPYDRARTTTAAWPLCAACRAEYEAPSDRRFHAETTACPGCGPRYFLLRAGGERIEGGEAVASAARMVREGAIIALKGIGGYHLCCDAANGTAVAALRERKFRKARPFAVMARSLDVARRLVELESAAEALLTSAARPIVLAPARATLPGVAPDGRELGVMLPYAPVHHLLFAAGAPEVVVMTSGNRSSEPIAFDDRDALDRLDGIADAFLAGERPIARRMDDSVARIERGAPVILRRGRGYAPGVVARLPPGFPILAVGADLKNTITLAIGGHALASQHIGDLEQASAREAHRAAIQDLLAMHETRIEEVVVVHDAHPDFVSAAHGRELPARRHVAVQHHRAHVASVLAERGALDARVAAAAWDGTGYGDDGAIWGSEFFAGSVADGLSRVGSLRPFVLPGGEAAARHPVQAAAGVLFDVEGLPDLSRAPFSFPVRYAHARQLVQRGVRTFQSTSAGRLFDAAASLLGFTAPLDYEGQAAMWLEALAWRAPHGGPLPFLDAADGLDLRPALHAIAHRRLRGEDERALARAFHETVAAAIGAVLCRICEEQDVEVVVLSGGTFQNVLLLERLRELLPARLQIWTNRQVPPNDGGISLGQAALAAAAGG